jgi:hypothetical protein
LRRTGEERGLEENDGEREREREREKGGKMTRK